MQYGCQLFTQIWMVETSARFSSQDKRVFSSQQSLSVCPDSAICEKTEVTQNSESSSTHNPESLDSFTAPSSSLFSLQTKCPNYESFIKDDKDTILHRESLWENIFNQTSYYFEDGFRQVYPYYHTYHVNVKGRWVGSTIDDAFRDAFYPIFDTNWVERDILAGQLTVNGSVPSKDHKLKLTDKILHTVHRHELPVRDTKVDILHCDSHILVVNKPASIPIHPTGRYQHNSLLYILAREFQMCDLHVVYRLDMGTSGVLILARNKSAATFFSTQIMNRKTKKTYLARVVGKFPCGVVECDAPIKPIDPKTRIQMVSSDGKPSKTTFESIAYNTITNTSLVVCKPHTGRTHQLRVHLQYLGFPIDDDYLYNHPCFGPERAKGGKYVNSFATIIRSWEAERTRWNHRSEERRVGKECQP